MRRHVDHVARRGHQRSQSIGTALGTIGIVGRLDEVNVVVQRASMIGKPRNRPLERLEDARRLRLRCTVLLPVVPRHRVHRGVGVQRLDIRIVGKLRCHLLHRCGVGAIQCRAIASTFRRIAHRQGLDERTLTGAGTRSGGPGRLDRDIRRPAVVTRHRRVEIGTKRERLAPIRHRQRRIQARGFAKRADRLGVIERIQQPNALIEEPLGSRCAGRDGHVQRPQAAQLGCKCVGAASR
jgi:hypothetical protein